MKKVLTALIAGLTLLCMTGLSQASLVTIGTANYGSSTYNLIWDDNNNGNSIVWLDYTHTNTNWSDQNAWAASLDSTLTINVDGGYIVDWGANSWRLPDTVDGPYVLGYDGTTTAGYNITNSEMGHLFYEELGNTGYQNVDGTYNPKPLWPDSFLQNTGNFDNLTPSRFWSGTESTSTSGSEGYAWYFGMQSGYYNHRPSTDGNKYGLAVRSGHVSTVPVPTTIWLFGTGLVGLAALKKKDKKDK